MSEELKLLPCPLCEEHPCMLGKQVVCCKINVEGISAWNALPRALTWTTEPPKVEGVYFRLCDNLKCEGKKSDTIKIRYTPISIAQVHTGYCTIPNKICDKCRWAGPIPAPKEPTP